MASSLKIHKEYSPLFGKDKSGKTRVWQLTIFEIANGQAQAKQAHADKAHADKAQAVIQHGVFGGKLQTDVREYTEGKNKGKKNETTALEQCVSESEKKRKDKIEKEGYVEAFPDRTPASNESVCRKIFPMLANKYEPSSSSKKRAGIVFPCYVQPKLDGLRCVVYLDPATQNPVYQSRTGGIFNTLHHLDAAIRQLLKDSPELVLDGELYTKQIPFEELAGIIKKKAITSQEDIAKIQCVQYHLYDIVLSETPFRLRTKIIRDLPNDQTRQFIEIVPTHYVNAESEFREKFGEFVAQGHEGIMLRNVAGLYQENYRSNDLMKYKEFFESEYPIVGFKEAAGRDEGPVIWECETPDGRRFCVRPRGTQESRREWFANAKAFVGSQLTVIYQELSEMGVPRFPVGKALRDGY
jgi:DNA ligase-1